MASLFRKHEGIEGYPVPGLTRPIKLIQYADDTTQLTKKGDGIQSAVNAFITFRNAAGCVLHPDKTKGLMLQTEEQPWTSIKIDWNEPQGIKILGIHFFQDLQYAQNYNWMKTLKKVEQKVQILMHRNLSLKGKVVILNSTVLSKVWYLSTIFNITKSACIALERIIFKMLWGDANPEPIRREIIY